MEAIIRKYIARISKYIVVQQLGWGRNNVVVFFLEYVVCFYTSCVITAVLKTCLTDIFSLEVS